MYIKKQIYLLVFHWNIDFVLESDLGWVESVTWSYNSGASCNWNWNGNLIKRYRSRVKLPKPPFSSNQSDWKENWTTIEIKTVFAQIWFRTNEWINRFGVHSYSDVGWRTLRLQTTATWILRCNFSENLNIISIPNYLLCRCYGEWAHWVAHKIPVHNFDIEGLFNESAK